MKTVTLLALLLGFVLAVAPVKADDQKSSLLALPTTSRTIYLLFHKMSGLVLHSTESIQRSAAYQKASPDDQAKILTTLKPVIEKEYADLDPKRQVIIVRAAVNIAVKMTPRASLEAKFMEPTRPIQSVYFPYNWGGMSIAVVPDQLAPYFEVPLAATEAVAASSKINGGTATVVIEMLPSKTDPTPMRLDGVSQWLLSSKVVAVTYYNQSLDTIWQWQAPGYRRKGDAEPLADLKK